jgi:hypothetical protein
VISRGGRVVAKTEGQKMNEFQAHTASTGLILVVACSAATFFNPSRALAVAEDRGVEIATLSSRPDTVSGGDVVVEVRVPQSLRVKDIVVELNGVKVTEALVADRRARRLIGLVSGLALGKSTLTAGMKSRRGHRPFTTLEISNYPASGPVFSGPRQQPWVCETSASGLGDPPTVGPCIAPTRYDWFYRTTAGTFQPLASLSVPFPEDLATTTTIDGVTVPYIVRVESGTINESVYRIAIIDDPTNPIHDPWLTTGKTPGLGWNGKLAYPFGGGSNPGYRSGSNTVTSALQHTPLSLGFAVAFGTRNTYATGSDDIISAETVAMIKERFIEQYGVPRFTIGSGGSGGAMQQHYIAQNYPGLLDALTPGIAYPDGASVVVDVLDCRLLNNYFDNFTDPELWPGTRRAMVDGYTPAISGAQVGRTTCQNGWAGYANRWQDPVNGGFSPVVPLEVRYDPVTNPIGVRGTFWDNVVNAMGRDPATGFARSPYDNVGIQYGLNALNAGDITVEEFLDLNENIGGLDIDGHIVPQRSAGDPIGLENAYRHGRVVTAGANLSLPIIETRGYTDQIGDIHTRIRTFAFLSRLLEANGTTLNEVNWLTGGGNAPDLASMALRAHDEWLEAILADTSTRPYAEKVITNKPVALADACWFAGVKYEEPFTLDPDSTCNQLMPIFATTRIAAGASIAGDDLKCQLGDIDYSDYDVAFTPEEQQRLTAIFPNGVCDWSKPSIAKRKPKTWLTYKSAGRAVSLDDDHDRHARGAAVRARGDH